MLMVVTTKARATTISLRAMGKAAVHPVSVTAEGHNARVVPSEGEAPEGTAQGESDRRGQSSNLQGKTDKLQGAEPPKRRLQKPAKNTLIGFRVTKQNTIKSILKTCLLLTAYVITCSAVMVALERDWSAIDAAYFSMAVMSTVGYGDFYPSSSGSRVFTIFMIIVGVGFVFSAVAGVVTKLTSPITSRGRQMLEQLFPQDGVDIDGDGVVDFYKPRPPLVYYCKNLLPSFLLTMLLQLLSGAIFIALEPWDYGSAMYHCLVTATTVGFGDVYISTQAGRAWACVHILLSVALLGELISTFDDLRAKRAASMARIRMLTTRLNSLMLDNLLNHAKTMRPLVMRDGLGLAELEFVLAMMLELGVIEMEQVKPFIKQFRLLDVDGNARLGRADLDASCNKSLAELQMAATNRQKLARQMSVGDRMGLSLIGTPPASVHSGSAIPSAQS